MMQLKIKSPFEVRSKTRYNFHVSKKCRDKYKFDLSLYTITGDLIIANFPSARFLSNQINEIRRKEKSREQFVTAGQINALALIHEIYHFIIRLYEEKYNPDVLSRGLQYLQKSLGEDNFYELLLEYTKEFPPLDIYKNKISAEEYLNSSTHGKPNKEIIMEELIILQIENMNPATISLEELYSDKTLSNKSKYVIAVDNIEKFFAKEKPFGADNLPLIHFLRKPVITNPYSLEKQLDYIREVWGIYVYDKFNERLLKGRDLISEDLKLFLQHGGGEKGTPPVPEYDFDYFEKLRAKLAAGVKLTPEESAYYYSEIEKFTLDSVWMPEVVMLAKNAFVWLDQLSKKYQRSITRLDQVPDQELDLIASWNFSALWLIGLWERSSASRRIKQLTGNPEAAASAYSLYDYIIAHDLGGEEAFENLKNRAWQRGIRMASDMVPNHTGIYSKWVVEKPHYFIQSDYPPYPGYSFYGTNLSEDARVEVRIEDKYYSRSDAAVVFQRRDMYTGDIKYIYHGNDGTNMPWNDTAQLNLLNPEVRESLIQTILHVARKTPIIRFDAAMTLTKKHYQRLWFPLPGTGGAIPSRSDYSMTREQFDAAMPEEFWREVVDRINRELPNTLLLAEAFWLMEGYFVRTLGMHRVYNSAFMHMMMKEENEKYHFLIKNTLEFNPEILKRYVNFMSNPDEETAVNQFGKGDKYFGITVLMVTFPGLPMFAHGQIEGLSEKYGMEYKRSYYDEHIDENLVRRHEYEIFPLLSRRHLFSQVENFELFDFIDNNSKINHNVFAFTNRVGDDRALIIYNNSYSQTAGTIKYSSPKVSSANRNLSTTTLADALNIKYDYQYFYIYHDHKTGLEYLFSGKELHEYGFYIALQGYEYRACINFREIYDTTGLYDRLNNSLRGRGAHSIEQVAVESRLSPVHNSLNHLLSHEMLNNFVSYCFREDNLSEKENGPHEIFFTQLENKSYNLIGEINRQNDIQLDAAKFYQKLNNEVTACRQFSISWQKKLSQKRKLKIVDDISSNLKIFNHAHANVNRNILFCAFVIRGLESLSDDHIFEKFLISKSLLFILENSNLGYESINENIHLIKILSSKKLFTSREKKQSKAETKNEVISNFTSILDNAEVQSFLNINQFEGITYISKERLESLLDWIFTLCAVDRSCELFLSHSKLNGRKAVKKNSKKAPSLNKLDKEKALLESLKTNYTLFEKIKQAASTEGYKLYDIQRKISNNNTKPVAKKVTEGKGAKKSTAKKTISNNKRRNPN